MTHWAVCTTAPYIWLNLAQCFADLFHFVFSNLFYDTLGCVLDNLNLAQRFVYCRFIFFVFSNLVLKSAVQVFFSHFFDSNSYPIVLQDMKHQELGA